MNIPSLLLVAIACGALIPIHAGMNAGLSQVAGHSFGVSFACLSLVVILFQPTLPTWVSLAAAAFWVWFGGAIGVVYVIATMMLAPRLGAARFIAAIVAGQIIMALLIDLYGLIGFPRHTVDLSRILGAVFVIGGVVAMQFN
ncbi:MAG: DMT family transporter [Rhizobiaceae bacterium]|nr:DMT family transporter [Rhizobiaceae bacterium]